MELLFSSRVRTSSATRSSGSDSIALKSRSVFAKAGSHTSYSSGAGFSFPVSFSASSLVFVFFSDSFMGASRPRISSILQKAGLLRTALRKDASSGKRKSFPRSSRALAVLALSSSL